MRPLALRWRLSLLMAGALAVSVGAIGAIVYSETKELFRKDMDQSLLGMARAAEEIASDTDDPATVSTKLSALFPASGRHPKTLARLWDDRTGRQVYAAPGPGTSLAESLGRQSAPAPGNARYFTLVHANRAYRGVWYRSGNGQVHVALARPTGPMQAELDELLGHLFWISACVIVGMSIVAILLAHVGLRPVRQAADRLRTVAASDLPEVDMDAQSVAEELRPFADALRQMLQRVYAAMQQQKAFVADASHELRTPMTAAKSTIQTTLASPRGAEEYRTALRETLEDLCRMEHLVEELLTLARLDEGHDAMETRPVALDALLADVTESLASQAAESGGRIDRDLSATTVAGDARHLGRMFSNLVDNALRHGPPGGTVRVTCRPSDDRAIVVVRDEGGRIPPEALPHLFERFYRADASRNAATGGTGLGLAIAREIVVRHGGTLEITSHPDTGTEATVSLPREKESDPA